MLELWKQRGMFERTEQQLASQARSIEKNGYLSEEELKAIKKTVGFSQGKGQGCQGCCVIF